MKYLILIGNGFDLAHGMKTGYGDFLKWLVESELKKEGNQGIITSSNKSYSFENITEFSKGYTPHSQRPNQFTCSNEFLMRLISRYANQNWCDIEQEYYNELTKPTYCKNINNLNKDFESIKNRLEKYINLETIKCSENELLPLFNFFNKFNRQKSLIVSFNYTDTVNRYNKNSIKTINLHGELNSYTNPIIFGYAATDEKCKILSQKQDENGNYNSEYLKNIKRFCYKNNMNGKKYLDEFMTPVEGSKFQEKIIVLTLGISLGLSDEMIIKEIFNNPIIHKIVPLYYEEQGFNDYPNLQENAYRIMNNGNLFDVRFKGIEESLRMPQPNDKESLTQEFLGKLEDNSILEDELYSFRGMF